MKKAFRSDRGLAEGPQAHHAQGDDKPALKGGIGRLLQLRIGARTSLGFAAVLALTTVVSVVGWNSLNGFADRVETADDMGNLVTQLLLTRMDEKNFQIRQDNKDVEGAIAGIAKIRQEGARLRAKLQTAADRKMVDGVLEAVTTYEKSFLKYTDMEKKKAQALSEMVQMSDSAQKLAQRLGEAEKTAADELQTGVQQMEKDRADRLEKADAASLILTRTGEMRRYEKDLLLSGESQYAQKLVKAIQEIMAMAEGLQGRFTAPETTKLISDIIDELKAYRTAYNPLAEILANARNTTIQQTIAHHDMEGHAKAIEGDLPKLKEALSGQMPEAEALGEIDKIYKGISAARFTERDFLIRPTATAAATIRDSLQEITKTSTSLKNRFSTPALTKVADHIIAKATAYGASFKSLSDLRYLAEGDGLKKRLAIDDMVNRATKFEELTSALRTKQQAEYQAIADKFAAAQTDMAKKKQLADDANRLINKIIEVRQAEKSFLLDGDADSSALAEKVMTSVLSLADDMKGRLESADNQKLIDAMRSMAQSYLAKFKDVVNLTHEQRIADGEMVNAATQVNDVIFQARSGQQAAMLNQKDTADSVTVFGTLGALALGLVLAFFIGRSVSRPVRQMTSTMQRLASGDLKVDVPAQGRADEIGEMAGAVQIFKDNAAEKVRLEAEHAEAQRRTEEEKKASMAKLARDFEEAVGVVVDQVSTAASEMRSSSQSMSETAEGTTRQASAVAAASEQASANVETVASAAEELSSSIAEIGRQVTQASQIASAAVAEAEETNVKVRGLAEAANKIGEVVALITDIAEQTNLLALNATIEAARAGDAGKGFAVVASEVKNLANQTAKATDEIGAQIGGIQSATREAVSAIEAIGKTIAQINDVNSNVASAVEEQGAATQEIARNVEQAATGTHEVSANIAGVSQAANETGAAAGQINTAASELSQQSERLRAEVDRFLSDLRVA